MTSQNITKELVLTRIFNAPRELVWKAWTTPNEFASWYGQPGGSVPLESVEMDVRVGGRWKSTTIFKGNPIYFLGEYREVVEPEKLVLTMESPEDPNIFELVTVILEDLRDGKTKMYFKQEGGNLPPEEYETGLKKGWTGFFNVLQEFVEKK